MIRFLFWLREPNFTDLLYIVGGCVMLFLLKIIFGVDIETAISKDLSPKMNLFIIVVAALILIDLFSYLLDLLIAAIAGLFKKLTGKNS